MKTTRERAEIILAAINEHNNDYDALDAIVGILDQEPPQIYKYKGNGYQVLDEGLMKNPETKEWEDAVFYKPTSDPESIAAHDLLGQPIEIQMKTPVYCRNKKDFMKKFSHAS